MEIQPSLSRSGPRSGQGGTLNWNSTACTCFVAGGMPLAFMQEAFLVTAHIHSMMGRYCFHRCLSVNILGGIPHLRSGWGITPFQVWGVPHVRGVPHVQGDPISGGTPCPRVPYLGRYPMSGGVPHLHTPHCTKQHSEHLLRSGRCACCVHAGGLSC